MFDIVKYFKNFKQKYVKFGIRKRGRVYKDQ